MGALSGSSNALPRCVARRTLIKLLAAGVASLTGVHCATRFPDPADARLARDERGRDAGSYQCAQPPRARHAPPPLGALAGCKSAGHRTNVLVGSAVRGRIQTFLPVEVTLRVDCGKKRQAGEKRHYFSWEEPPRGIETNEDAPAPRANPVRVAREWKRAMEERGESRADLARRLGVSRARVTPVLSILDLAPDVLELLERQSGPGMVSERALRGLQKLPAERHRERLLSGPSGEKGK